MDTIKTGEFKPIQHFKKIIHTINTTEYENTYRLIKNNVNYLQNTNPITKPLLNILTKNLEVLKAKIII